MLGPLKPFVVGLILFAWPAFAITPAQCKAGCKTEVKPSCEKACRTHAPKVVELCLKEMCEVAMKRCDLMCEDPPPKGKAKGKGK